VHLTKTTVDRLEYGKDNNKQDIRWDDDLSSFGVRLYPSGKKSFVLTYRRLGRKHIMVLGQYGQITLAQAKSAAKTQLAKLRLSDEDPLDTRHKQRTAATIPDLCRKYFSDHAVIHKKTWKNDEQRIKNHILPAWKNALSYQ